MPLQGKTNGGRDTRKLRRLRQVKSVVTTVLPANYNTIMQKTRSVGLPRKLWIDEDR